MDQVSTTISRRSVVLGGPTAAALAPLASLTKLAAVAPIGAAAVLGGVHTNATAVTPTTANFKTWYRGNFHPSAKTKGLDVLFDRYKDLRVSNPSWPAYTYAQSRTDDVMIDMQNKISSVGGTAGLNTAVRTALRAGGGTYTAADLTTYSNYLFDLANADLNTIKQHDSRFFNHIYIFIFHTRSASDFDNFVAKLIIIETIDDARHLRGTVDDSWVEGKTWLGYPNGKLSVKLGNLRKPVERRELVPNGSWLTRMFWIDRGNTTDSEIKHGINATQIEPASVLPNYTTSTAYNITNSTNDTTYVGIDGYIDADLEKNGPLPNMTDAETVSNMRRFALFVARDTGLVYESYLVASLAIRALTQAAIAATRLQIFNKQIDVAALVDFYKKTVENTPELQALAQASSTRLVRSSVCIFSGILGGLITNSIVMFETRKVVIANKGKNTTVATDKLQANQAVMAALTGIHSTAALAALGWLNLSPMYPGDSLKPRTQWIGTGFALSDISGAIADYVTVFRAGTERTPAGVSQLLGGTFRIAGSCYALASQAYKLWEWTYVSWTTRIDPLKFTTVTAASAAMLYALAMGFQAA